MKRFSWQFSLSAALLMLSAFLYWVHYLIFRDMYHAFFYLLGDLAFIPIQVLLVTLVIHRLLEVREKRLMLNKLNMVIGVFYSEVGITLLKTFSKCDTEIGKIQQYLIVKNDWPQKEFQRIKRIIKAPKQDIDIKCVDLEGLRCCLLGKRGFLLTLLENPNLLEHETFTDLLWAVFHLTEELANRGELDKLPTKDLEHLANDTKRAYNSLISEWFSYMGHLNLSYPYLFSLAMRTNPFDPNASAVIK